MTGTTIKGAIQREDLALFDGKTLVAQRPNSSGGTQTGNRMGDAVDVKLIHGGTANAASFQAALDSIGTANAALLFTPETWTIAANVTVPANVTLIVPAGCVFSINSGITVTNNGILIRYHKTYTSGSGTFTQNGIDNLQTVDQTDIFGLDTGSTNAYAITTDASISTLTTGVTVRFEASSTNTASCTLAVDGLTAKTMKPAGTANTMTAGMITSGGFYTCVFDAGSDIWQVINYNGLASTGDLTLDSEGDIVLDANGADVLIKDAGTTIGQFTNSSSDFVVEAKVQDKDIIFKGNDGGSGVTALTLDMSEAGKATFNAGIVIPDAGNIGSASDTDAMAISSSGQVTFSQQPKLAFASRNYLINGDFAVGQRGTSFASGSNDDTDYTLDRWKLFSDTDDVVDVAQITSGVPTGNKYALDLDVEKADKKFGVAQIIENVNCGDLIGQTVTLSFKAKVNATTNMDNVKAAIIAWSSTADSPTDDMISAWGVEGTNPTLASNFTYENTPADLNVTTSWADYSVSAAVDTSSTTNIIVFIWSDVTTTTAGTDHLYLANVQLELGSHASNFQTEDYGTNLLKCQRYYETVAKGASYSHPGNSYATNATVGHTVEFKVTKHKAPVISVSGLGTSSGEISVTAATGSFVSGQPSSIAARLTVDHAAIYFTSASSSISGLTDDSIAMLYGNGSSFFYFDAEI